MKAVSGAGAGALEVCDGGWGQEQIDRVSAGRGYDFRLAVSFSGMSWFGACAEL